MDAQNGQENLTPDVVTTLIQIANQMKVHRKWMKSVLLNNLCNKMDWAIEAVTQEAFKQMTEEKASKKRKDPAQEAASSADSDNENTSSKPTDTI